MVMKKARKNARHPLHGTPTYVSWQAMKQRCNDPGCKDYAWYGAKGIKVCVRWRTFDNFLADMGLRPAETTLDRKSSAGNYEPRNCRWADKFQQKHNRSDNVLLTRKGITQPLAVWAREFSLNWCTLRDRLGRGWPLERALTAKVMRKAA